MSGGHGHPGIPPGHRPPMVGSQNSRGQIIGAQGLMIGPRSPDGRTPNIMHSQRNVNNHPQFVNIAAASPRPQLTPIGLRPGSQIRIAAPEAHQGQPAVQTPPLAHAQGAINLTITNGRSAFVNEI